MTRRMDTETTRTLISNPVSRRCAMKSLTSRFTCPSSSLRMNALLGRARKGLGLALALAVGAHLSLTRLVAFETETQAAKPLTTQFIKRQPRLTKPLEMKKHPRPKRRQVERQMVTAKAELKPGGTQARFQPTHLLGDLARPHVHVARMAGLVSVPMEPASAAEAVKGTKDVEQVIDMSLELLDIQALDTGKYHALVVQDPEDKTNISGFCHLAIAELPREAFDYPYTFEYYVLPGFLRIPAAINDYTDIKADILGRIRLDDAQLFKVPWLFLTAHLSFQLSPSELENLGKYLMSGGFAFADAADQDHAAYWRAGLRALLTSLRDALETQGAEAILQKLPNSHPVYHCYFDFDGPPIGSEAWGQRYMPDLSRIIDYLEGIEVDTRLVAVISRKHYTWVWTFCGPGGLPSATNDWDDRPAFRFAVNTIIFALTQEGSITHRLMESVR